jgi:hypothetical protein
MFNFNFIPKGNLKITLKYQEECLSLEVEPYRTFSFIRDKAYTLFYPIHFKIKLTYLEKDLTPYENHQLGDFFKHKLSVLIKVCDKIKPLANNPARSLLRYDELPKIYSPLKNNKSEILNSLNIMTTQQSKSVEHSELKNKISKIKMNSSPSQKTSSYKCFTCHDQIIEYYCRVCNTFLCKSCKINTYHNMHQVIPTRIPKYKEGSKNYSTIVLSDLDLNVKAYKFEKRNKIDINKRKCAIMEKLKLIEEYYNNKIGEEVNEEDEDKEIENTCININQNLNHFVSDISNVNNTFEQDNSAKEVLKNASQVYSQINLVDNKVNEFVNLLTQRKNQYETLKKVDNMYKIVERALDAVENELFKDCEESELLNSEMIGNLKSGIKSSHNTKASTFRGKSVEMPNNNSVSQQHNEEETPHLQSFGKEMLKKYADKAKDALTAIQKKGGDIYNSNYSLMGKELITKSAKKAYDILHSYKNKNIEEHTDNINTEKLEKKGKKLMTDNPKTTINVFNKYKTVKEEQYSSENNFEENENVLKKKGSELLKDHAQVANNILNMYKKKKSLSSDFGEDAVSNKNEDEDGKEKNYRMKYVPASSSANPDLEEIPNEENQNKRENSSNKNVGNSYIPDLPVINKQAKGENYIYGDMNMDVKESNDAKENKQKEEENTEKENNSTNIKEENIKDRKSENSFYNKSGVITQKVKNEEKINFEKQEFNTTIKSLTKQTNEINNADEIDVQNRNDKEEFNQSKHSLNKEQKNENKNISELNNENLNKDSGFYQSTKKQEKDRDSINENKYRSNERDIETKSENEKSENNKIKDGKAIENVYSGELKLKDSSIGEESKKFSENKEALKKAVSRRLTAENSADPSFALKLESKRKKR